MNDTLTVICTDRGTHKPRTLARLDVKVQHGRVVIGRVSRTRRYRTDDGRVITPRSAPEADDARRRDDDGLTFTFTCPTCGRNTPCVTTGWRTWPRRTYGGRGGACRCWMCPTCRRRVVPTASVGWVLR